MSDPSCGRGAGSGGPCLSDLLDAYRCYLEGERGLSPLTVHGYVQTAERFVLGRCAGDPARLADLSARDVSGFVLAESSRGLSPRTVNEVVVRLRSLLRYLYVKGLIDAPLAQATPWMAGSRAGPCPAPSSPEQGRASWPVVTSAPRAACGTSPSWRSSSGSACAPARSSG